MPTFTDTLPTGAAWCAVVLVLGALMTFVAVRGYGFVAEVGHLAAPWMLLVFVACGVVTMGKLGTTDLVALLTPPPGTEAKIGFWGVFSFAWFCNAAVHLGMSDLSILRYARKPSYGWASAAGMYLGHCIAWLCAALLLVYWVRAHGTDPQLGEAPGPMVYDAVGWAGILCVVVAGWTTANPTIYRAGLAFQGMFPAMSRTAATLLAGAICTAAGLFPWFAMKLLGFVGIYGMILAPVGAIIVVDVLLARRLGLASDPAARFGWRFNVAALVAWLVPAALGLWAFSRLGLALPTYVTLPVWLASGVLYAALLKRLQPRTP
jgi:purine-cytosine permease-like protein